MLSRASIRKWHSYIGLFTAPSILFFSLTGSLQIYHLHEGHGDYQPMPIVEKLASVHKDQEFRLGEHHGPPGGEHGAEQAPPDEQKAGDQGPSKEPGDEKADHHDDHDKGDSPAKALLQAFFLIVGLSLSVSTIFGIWIGLFQTPRKKLAWSLLVAGAVIPIVLILL